MRKYKKKIHPLIFLWDPPSMNLPLVLLIAVLATFFIQASYAVPSGCWEALGGNMTYPSGLNDGSVLYQLRLLRLCFLDSFNHNITFSMYVTAKGYRPQLMPDATIIGNQFYGSPQQITFSYPNTSSCYNAAPPFCCDLCPIPGLPTNPNSILIRFAGDYGFRVQPSLAAPTDLSIVPASVPRGNPDDNNPIPYQWGGLPTALDLHCSSGCGSFDDVLPPAPFPDNITVRRSYDDSESVLEDNIN